MQCVTQATTDMAANSLTCKVQMIRVHLRFTFFHKPWFWTLSDPVFKSTLVTKTSDPSWPYHNYNSDFNLNSCHETWLLHLSWEEMVFLNLSHTEHHIKLYSGRCHLCLSLGKKNEAYLKLIQKKVKMYLKSVTSRRKENKKKKNKKPELCSKEAA